MPTGLSAREREWRGKRLTISDRRASAGSSVGGASLCRSMASSTRTNLQRGSRVGSLSIAPSATVSCDSVSQRLRCWSHLRRSSSSRASRRSASATAPTMRSKRCRPVMHCAALTMAYRRLAPPSLLLTTLLLPPPSALPSALPLTGRDSARCDRSCDVTADLPVASVPWRTRLRQGAASGYERYK